jgi:hypothetical protein
MKLNSFRCTSDVCIFGRNTKCKYFRVFFSSLYRVSELTQASAVSMGTEPPVSFHLCGGQ